MARPVFRIVAIALITLFTSLASAHAAGLAALVSDSVGKVEKFENGKWSAAPVMTMLSAGDQVRVASGGKATLSFVQGGAKAYLTGPCSVSVQTDSVKTLLQNGGGSVKNVTASARSATRLSANVNIDRMGGQRTRGGSGSNSFAFISDPGVGDLQPTLTWVSGAQFASYTIVITDDETRKEIVRQNLDKLATSYKVTAPLQYGKTYAATLTGRYDDASEKAADEFSFTVVDKATLDGLAQAKQEAEAQFREHAEDVTPLVLLMVMYAEQDMYTPVVDLAQRISQVRPNKSTYEIMAKIYGYRQDAARSKQYEDKAKALEAAL